MAPKKKDNILDAILAAYEDLSNTDRNLLASVAARLSIPSGEEEVEEDFEVEEDEDDEVEEDFEVEEDEEDEFEIEEEEDAAPAKRGPGRPPKTAAVAAPAKRGPGRPPKTAAAAAPAKRGPGRR